MTFEGLTDFYLEVDLICFELLTELFRDFGIVILGILSFESLFSPLDAYFSFRGGFFIVFTSLEIELGFLIFFIFCKFFFSLQVSKENFGLHFLEEECCLMVISSCEDSSGRVSRESFPYVSISSYC